MTLPQGGAGGFFARGASGARGPSGAGGFFGRGRNRSTWDKRGARALGRRRILPARRLGPDGSARLPREPDRGAAEGAHACASLRPAGAGGGFGGGPFDTSNPATAKFVACLKQHGVQAGSTTDRTSTEFQAAFAACRSLLPAGAGGFPGGGGGGTAGSGTIGGGATDSGAAGSTSADFAKFQACLKQHGVQPGAASQSQSTTSAALAACRALLPNNGNGSATTTTAG